MNANITKLAISTAPTAIVIILLNSGARITAELGTPNSSTEWDGAMAEIGRASEVRNRRDQITGLIYISHGSPANYNRAEAMEVLGLEG